MELSLRWKAGWQAMALLAQAMDLPVETLLAKYRRGEGVVGPQADEKLRALDGIARMGIEAWNALFHANIALVFHVVKRCNVKGLDPRDLAQEGMRGLMRAVELFDGARGFRFSTYAAYWIEQAVKRYVDRELARRKTLVEEPRQESYEAQDDGEDQEGIYVSLLSLDDPVGRKDEAERDTLADLVASSDQSPVLWSEERSLRTFLEKVVLPRLSQRERLVLERRYGLNGSEAMTLKEIASLLGVSQERVRQIEEEAKEKIREEFPGLAEYL